MCPSAPRSRCFNTPDFIKSAAVKAIEENYNSYTPVDGYDSLKDSIIHKFKRDNDLNFKKSQIVVSTGAKQSLYNIASVLIEKNDEVILPCPYWVSYSDIIKLKGGVPVEIKTDIKNDFKMTAAELESSITPNTKMIWFSSPCNPSGSVYNMDELKKKRASKGKLVTRRTNELSNAVFTAGRINNRQN